MNIIYIKKRRPRYNPEDGLGSPTTTQSTAGVWTAGEYGGHNVVIAFDVVFPVTPSNGCLAEKGGSGFGLWIGLRDQGTVFRARAFYGGASIVSSTSPATTAWVDTTEFPTDGNTHTVVLEIRKYPARVRLWIDGIYKGEGTKYTELNNSNWEGGGSGGFLTGINSNVVGEPTAAWPGGTTGQLRMYLYKKIWYDVPDPITNNLVLSIDPQNINSYPGSGGTIYDLTTNDYDGTFQNGARFEDSIFGKCIRFDGVDEYVNFATHPEFTTSSFSVNVWFHGINSQPSNYATLITKEGDTNLGNYSLAADSLNNYVRFGFWDGSNTIETSNSSYSDVKAYSWRNYTGVFNYNNGTNSLILYTMGKQISSTITSSTPATTVNNLVLGYRPNTANYGFNGRIGLVQIFDTALTSTQVANHFSYWTYFYYST